ncbi:AraC family transcriptional regulator [Aurantivibrio infirmus]
MSVASKNFDRSDIGRKVAKAGTGHQVTPLSSARKDNENFLNGKFELTPVQTGFYLHAWEGKELEDAVASINLAPSVVFSVVLEGRLEFSIDGQQKRINDTKEIKKVGGDLPSSANCFAINLMKPACLARKIRKGAEMRKLNITVDPRYLGSLVDERLAPDAPINYFLLHHLELPTWQASAKLIEIAELILNPPMPDGVFRKLYVESKVIEFVIESLRSIAAIYSDAVVSKKESYLGPERSLPSKSKAGKIKEKIDAQLLSGDFQMQEKCLEKIARSVGMSVSSLQRVFKRNFGQTVVEYVRLYRLRLARKAIEDDNASIGEAAYIAGYKHSSNFSLAFKKTFGISPGMLYQS